MFLTVIVPTYRRPKDLERCLTALKQQTRSADEVLVIVRDTDTDTWEFLKTFNLESLPLRILTVTTPGQVAALNQGLDAAQGDIISITDDDAAPHPQWLERIETHFVSDNHIGGVGGRDWIYKGMQSVNETREVVGQIQWFGRRIGNHHMGTGKSREVDVLKGANMSYRRTAIVGVRFDERFRGEGSQIHNDMAFSLTLKRLAWKLIYDPLVAVDHYCAPRFDEDQRDRFSAIATENITHNETLTLLEHLPPLRRIVFLFWAIGIGTRGARGFLQWLRFLPSEGTLSTQKFLACMRGRWQGWQTWRLSSQNSQEKMI